MGLGGSKTRRLRLSNMAIGLLAAVVGFAPLVLGQSSYFPMVYSARLSNANGSPVDGPLDVELKFYSAEIGGSQLGNVYAFSGVMPVNGVMNFNLNLTSAQVAAIFGDGAESVYIEITADGKTYPRQRYSFVPLALRVPVDGKTLSFGDDGKLGLSLKSLPATNQFLTTNKNGELIWDTPATPTASSIQGYSISALEPATGQVLTYMGSEWVAQTPAGVNGAGTLGVAGGGTGATSFTNNGVLVGAGAGPVSATAAGAAGNVLTVGASGPEFGRVNLGSSAAVTGTLSLGNGGTGSDLRLSGGSGQYLKQSSAGAVISVGTIAAADITNSLGYTPLSKAGDTMSGALDLGTNDLKNAGNINLAPSKTLQLGSLSGNPAGLGASDSGKTWFDSIDSKLKYFNGSSVVTLGSSLTTLNGESGSTQEFAIPGTSGTAPAWVSASNIHTLNIPLASATGVTAGLISNSDYTAFSNKVGSITAGSGITASASGSAVTVGLPRRAVRAPTLR